MKNSIRKNKIFSINYKIIDLITLLDDEIIQKQISSINNHHY